MSVFSRIVEQILYEAEFNQNKFFDRVISIITLANNAGTPGEEQAARAAVDRMRETAKREAEAMGPRDSASFLADFERIASNLGNKGDKSGGRTGSSSSSSSRSSGSSGGSSGNSRRNEPPKEPRFNVGAWVYVTNDGYAGKVISRKRDTVNNEIWYELEGYEGDFVKEAHLRKATQDEIDAATAKRKSGGAKSSIYLPNWTIKAIARFEDSSSDKVYGYAVSKTTKTSIIFWGRFRGPFATKTFGAEQEAAAQYGTKIRKGYDESKIPSTYKSFAEITLAQAILKAGLKP